MGEFLYYLLKVSAGSMLLYFCYILLLSKDTFYLRNRIVLIIILVLPVAIPLFRFFAITAVTSVENTDPITTIITSGSNLGASMAKKISLFDAENLIKYLYFSVSGLFLLRLVVSLAQTYNIVRKGRRLSENFPKIVLSEKDITPFSFFPYIVVPENSFKSDDYNEIIAHETAHIRQGHTFDLLLSEIILVLFWVNPFMWLIKRSITLNHEYLADDFSIRKSSNIKEYQYKLLNIRKDLINIPLAHNFSSLIKNRIVMINKKPTPDFAALKSIIILPAAAILFVMFSFRQESVQVNKDYKFSKTSDTEILVFLAGNTGYPQEARNSLDTGKIYVTVKMNKTGIIKECKAYSERNEIKIPFLAPIVIVGKKPLTSQKVAGNDLSALKTESVRVANRLSELKIPEWSGKDVEFAIEFKFILR